MGSQYSSVLAGCLARNTMDGCFSNLRFPVEEQGGQMNDDVRGGMYVVTYVLACALASVIVGGLCLAMFLVGG